MWSRFTFDKPALQWEEAGGLWDLERASLGALNRKYRCTSYLFFLHTDVLEKNYNRGWRCRIFFVISRLVQRSIYG